MLCVSISAGSIPFPSWRTPSAWGRMGTAFVMATAQPQVKRITGEMFLMVTGLEEGEGFWVHPGNLLQ